MRGPSIVLADLVAGRVERSELVVGAEDGDRDGSARVVTEIVLVEGDAVRLGVLLEPLGCRLALQSDLDQALALVRVDTAGVVLSRRGAGQRQRAQREQRQRPPHGS